MDYILELISGLVGTEGNQRFIFIILVAGAVFALGLSVEFIVSTLGSPLRRRLAKMDNNVEWQEKEVAAGLQKGSDSNQLIDSLAKFLTPGNDKDQSVIQEKLIRAGFRTESSVGSFYAAKTILLIVFGLSAALVTRWYPELSSIQTLLAIGGGAFVGVLIPNYVLNYYEQKRMRALRNGFPDALDMLVVCVEAGQGINASIQRVGKEIGVSHPELADELNIVSAEMRLSVDLVTALKGLSKRTGLDEIRGLVALISQSARFGTGIAETLRIYSEEFRDKRMQMAEESAGKIGTKLIFPLTFCIWPGFFVVIIGPAILKIMEAFK